MRAHEAFRELYLKSKEDTPVLKFLDASEKFKLKHDLDPPHKSLSSFRASMTYHNKK